MIAIINGVFDKLRGLSFTIPDWSPIGAGAEIGFNWLPTLTPLAKGGFTNGPSLAGEAGSILLPFLLPLHLLVPGSEPGLGLCQGLVDNSTVGVALDVDLGPGTARCKERPPAALEV